MPPPRCHQATGTSPLTPADSFIASWLTSERAERTNARPFLIELRALLGVPAAEPTSGGQGPYCFERSVTHNDPADRSTIGHQLVRNSPSQAQQMLQAKGQAKGCVRNLPADEPAPPFIIVADIGFCFDLHTDFSGMGRHYAQFPDAHNFRLDLTNPAKRQLFATIWTNPQSLDPSRRCTEVTRNIAALLAEPAITMEARQPHAAVAFFLIRCIFCMFAQSAGLLPPASFAKPRTQSTMRNLNCA